MVHAFLRPARKRVDEMSLVLPGQNEKDCVEYIANPITCSIMVAETDRIGATFYWSVR